MDAVCPLYLIVFYNTRYSSNHVLYDCSGILMDHSGYLTHLAVIMASLLSKYNIYVSSYQIRLGLGLAISHTRGGVTRQKQQQKQCHSLRHPLPRPTNWLARVFLLRRRTGLTGRTHSTNRGLRPPDRPPLFPLPFPLLPVLNHIHHLPPFTTTSEDIHGFLCAPPSILSPLSWSIPRQTDRLEFPFYTY
jgi:hypothetical protein